MPHENLPPGALPPGAELDHVAVVVRDLNAAARPFRLAGLATGEPETVEDQGVEVLFAGGGGAHVELVRPVRPDTGVARFLEKHGEGLHHVALRVPDIDAAIAALLAAGMPMIDRTPRPGARGTRVAFVHPKGAAGVLLELVEPPRGS